MIQEVLGDWVHDIGFLWYKQLVFLFLQQLGSCGAWHTLISVNTLGLCESSLPGRSWSWKRTAEERAASVTLRGSSVMTLPGWHNAPTCGTTAAFQQQMEGWRQRSCAGLLQVNRGTITAANLPVSQHVFALVLSVISRLNQQPNVKNVVKLQSFYTPGYIWNILGEFCSPSAIVSVWSCSKVWTFKSLRCYFTLRLFLISWLYQWVVGEDKL